MVPYLTPRRYLSGGYGLDTSKMSAAEIRNTLVRATSLVSRYCNSATLPQEHDFRGGSITGEQHDWNIGNLLLADAGNRRVYPFHKPIRTVTNFVIKFTDTYEVQLPPPSSFFVNPIQNYVEVVAFAPLITGVYPIGMNFGLFTPIAELSYTYGWRSATVGDELVAESPEVYTASYGSWDVGADVNVYLDGVIVDIGDYTINYADGSITFPEDSAPTADVVVTADYTTTLPDAIAQATGITATWLIGQSRIAARGMIGLQSIRIAEVALTAFNPTSTSERNGVVLPVAASAFLGPYIYRSAGV